RRRIKNKIYLHVNKKARIGIFEVNENKDLTQKL
ncbi:hypothetical protein GJ496_009056, partial [Pomphorhynchus laevis]